MGVYNDLILNKLEYNIKHEIEGITYPYPVLSNYLDHITRGEYIAIGGRPMSGKTSFIDYTYVYNVYLKWCAQDLTTRKPLKILYFGLKGTDLERKLQRLTCTHLKQDSGTIINTATLNPNKLGKMYDLRDIDPTDEHDPSQNILNKLIEAEEFFDEFLENNFEFIEGQKTPSYILNYVTKYMDTIGETTKTEDSNGNETLSYQLDQEYEGQMTIVILDDVDSLLTESGDFAIMNEKELNKTMNDYLKHITKLYNTTTIVGVSSKSSWSKNPKDSEPNYKELDIYSKGPDKALIIYNPQNENQVAYIGLKISDFDIGAYNKLRTVRIVRNKFGTSNVEKPMLFLQEAGTFKEFPKDKTDRVKLLETYKELAKQHGV